jgi:hypothetical protein
MRHDLIPYKLYKKGKENWEKNGKKKGEGAGVVRPKGLARPQRRARL